MDWRDNAWPFGERHEHERLSALLDDELPTDDAISVTRHITSCERCFEEFEAIRIARQALRGLPGIEPPPDLHAIIDRIAADAPRGRSRSGFLAAAAATSAALLGAAFLVTSEEAGTIAPPVDLYVVDHVTTSNTGPILTPVDLRR